MQQDIVNKIQTQIRPGECVDMYYSNSENSTVQCHMTTQKNRFFVNLQNQGSSGSSSVVFNPDEGLGGVILTLQLPPPDGTTTYAGLALNKGWAYSLIRRIGVR